MCGPFLIINKDDYLSANIDCLFCHFMLIRNDSQKKYAKQVFVLTLLM